MLDVRVADQHGQPLGLERDLLHGEVPGESNDIERMNRNIFFLNCYELYFI